MEDKECKYLLKRNFRIIRRHKNFSRKDKTLSDDIQIMKSNTSWITIYQYSSETWEELLKDEYTIKYIYYGK